MKFKTRALILLVEHDHDTRVAVRQVLEGSHYEVLSAANGADALKILNRRVPELILLEMVMPLMDGEQFLKAKERDDRLREIPLIKLSKPLDLDDLIQKIPLLLAKKLDKV